MRLIISDATKIVMEPITMRGDGSYRREIIIRAPDEMGNDTELTIDVRNGERDALEVVG